MTTILLQEWFELVLRGIADSASDCSRGDWLIKNGFEACLQALHLRPYLHLIVGALIDKLQTTEKMWLNHKASDLDIQSAALETKLGHLMLQFFHDFCWEGRMIGILWLSNLRAFFPLIFKVRNFQHDLISSLNKFENQLDRVDALVHDFASGKNFYQ